MSRAYLILGGNTLQRAKMAGEIYAKIKPGSSPKNDPDTQILTSPTSIKIEEVRNLERLLSLKPYLAAPKVCLIPEAERLTFEAQAALLKLLEEPPGKTLLILATAQAENLLPTLVSRCEPIYLPPATELVLEGKELEAANLLLKEIIQSSPGERLKIVEKIKGREEAIFFCQKQLVLWQESLLKNPLLANAQVLREIQKTLKYLHANVNPRLALENLLLSYPFSQ